MAEIKLTINDPKTGKSYKHITEGSSLRGKKLKEKISGDLIGLKGYELEITGGSDKAGFPMRFDLPGPQRKKILLTKGPGVKLKRKGIRKRKTVAGNEISKDTVQVNLKILKVGAKKIEDILGKKEETPKEKAEEPKKEKKEETPKEEVKEGKKEEKKEEPKEKEETPKEEVKEEKKEEKKEEPKEKEETPKEEVKEEKKEEKQETQGEKKE